MPRQTTIKLLRTNKTNLDAQKAISNLIVGEPYSIIDTKQFAIADTVNSYTLYYNASEVQTALDGKANIADIPTNFDSLYYTKSEIDTKIGNIETLLEAI